MRLKPLPLDKSLVGIARLLAYPPGTWMEWNYRSCVVVRWESDYTLLVVRVRGKHSRRRPRYTLNYYNTELRVLQ